MDLHDSAKILSHNWDGSWTPSTGDEAHISTMHLEQVGPGIVHMYFSFGFWGKGVVLHHVIPEEPVLQRARFVMYSSVPAWLASLFLWNEANQFERDIYIWTNKRYVRFPLLVKNDCPIRKHAFIIPPVHVVLPVLLRGITSITQGQFAVKSSKDKLGLVERDQLIILNCLDIRKAPPSQLLTNFELIFPLE